VTETDGRTLAPWRGALRVVGAPIDRIDGPAKVSGRARYTTHVTPPGLLHAAVARSKVAAGTVRALDLSGAERLPGVRAVLAVAVPGQKIRFAGQDLAAVAATTPEIARAAVARIEVVVEPTPHVVTLDGAMADGAPRVHEDPVQARRTEGDDPTEVRGGGRVTGNVRPLPAFEHGDPDRAFARAAHVHEAVYETPVVLHSALEPHALTVAWDGDDAMTVWASTQSIFSVRDEMASIFGLSPERVTVICEHMGGGFGAKFGASAPGSRMGFIAGTLARKAGAPVRLALDRRAEQEVTGNRPSSRQRVRVAADGRGRVVALEVVSHGTAGVGTGAGVGRNAAHLYEKIPHRRVRAHDVFTHAGPGTAMRAPGHPQGAFALELALDELAAKIGADPLDLRIAHDRHPVRRREYELGRARFRWDDRRARARAARAAGARVRTGAGVAASIWGDFGRAKAARVTVAIERDGSVHVRNGVQDIGGGIATVLAAVVAEVLGRPVERVHVRYGASTLGRSVGSGGSQTTSSVAPAARVAAERARRALLEAVAEATGTPPGAVTLEAGGTVRVGPRRLSFEDACRLLDDDGIEAVGQRGPTRSDAPYPFPGGGRPQIGGVQFAAVEVDTWTGEVRCTHLTAVHDCGRVMNAKAAESQVAGGIMMGLGFALSEQRQVDPVHGRVLNADLERYKLPGFGELPEIDVHFVPVETDANETGSLGIGEPATIPTAAAVACAVFDALGVPVRTLPITPDRVLAALRDGRAEAAP